jgi:hypothetical protein
LTKKWNFLKIFKIFYPFFLSIFRSNDLFQGSKVGRKLHSLYKHKLKTHFGRIFFFGAFLTYFFDFSIFSKIAIFYNFSKKSKKTQIFRNFTDFYWFLVIFSDFSQILAKIHCFSLFLVSFTYFCVISAKMSKISKKREKMQKVLFLA